MEVIFDAPGEVKVTVDGTNVLVHLKDVRSSFMEVLKAEEGDNDDGTKNWSLSSAWLLPKSSKRPKAMSEAIKKAIALTWPGQDKSIPADKRCMGDGEPADPDSGEKKPKYEGYAGHYYVSSRVRLKSETAKNPIQLCHARKGADGKFPRFDPNSAEAAAHFYSGAFFDVILRVYGFNGKGRGPGGKSYPDRVNASIEVVKFKRHGEAFGAKKVDADSLLDEEDDDAFDEVPGQKSSPVDDLL